ncbi:4656_t:CDS:2, partial [Racocetra persica]
LLDYEPRAADQVPLLISMQEDELALIKAIESGDTDLVMLHLKRKLPLAEFFSI